MIRRFQNRDRGKVVRLLRCGLLLLCTALPVSAVQAQRRQSPVPGAGPQTLPKPGELHISADHGRITATIVDTPMHSALAELADRTGVVFEVRSQANPLVSVHLHGVSLHEAIQRIAAAMNTIFFYGDGRDSGRITFVQIYPPNDNTPQPSILYLGTGSVTKGSDAVDTVEQAIRALSERKSVEARERAVEILVKDKSGPAIEALIEALADPAAKIRSLAIEGLAALNVRGALPGVLKGLRDRSPAVRRSAASAVALLGSSGNIKDLKPLGSDRNRDVAAAAEAAIRRLSASDR